MNLHVAKVLMWCVSAEVEAELGSCGRSEREMVGGLIFYLGTLGRWIYALC